MRPLRPLDGLAAALLVLTLAVVGCRSGSSTSSSGAAPDAAPDASPSSRPSPSSPSSSSSAAADASAPVDLLRHTGAALAVSSNVDNPRDFPEHLVDGNLATAWNGRSGDLKAAWIAFRVPAGARVTRVELTAGFDKGELFTQNHRVKKVRITREGKELAVHTLDTEARGLQPITVDAPGGTFRVEIVETIPGTKTEWREVCISELRVLGVPAPESQPSVMTPQVGIGAFPGKSPAAPPPPAGIADVGDAGDWRITPGMRAAAPVLGRGWPSIAEMCRAYDAAVGPLLDADRKRGNETIPAKHACTPAGNLHESFVGTGEIKSVTRVRVFLEGWSEDRIAVETKHGFFLAEGDPIETESFVDPGCFGHTTVTVQSVRAVSGGVEVVTRSAWKNKRYLYKDDGTVDSWSDHDDIRRDRFECAIEGSRMRCTTKEIDRVCHAGKDVVDCTSF